MMKSVFSKKQPSPQETIRRNKRNLTQASRGLDKEITALQKEERKLVAEIKKTAETKNEGAIKILARQLIKLRQQIEKLQSSRTQLQGIAIQTRVMHSTTSTSASMRAATNAMATMNKQLPLREQMKQIQEFQKQSEFMGMTSDMMMESIDDIFDDDDTDEEVDEITEQVLAQLPLDISTKLQPAPREKIAMTVEELDSADEEKFIERFAALKSQ